MYEKGYSSPRGGGENESFMGSRGMDSKLMVFVCIWDPRALGTLGGKKREWEAWGCCFWRSYGLRNLLDLMGFWYKGMRGWAPAQCQWSLVFLLLEQHFLGNIHLWKTLYPPFTITECPQGLFPFPSDEDFLKTILSHVCSFISQCSLSMLVHYFYYYYYQH